MEFVCSSTSTGLSRWLAGAAVTGLPANLGAPAAGPGAAPLGVDGFPLGAEAAFGSPRAAGPAGSGEIGILADTPSAATPPLAAGSETAANPPGAAAETDRGTIAPGAAKPSAASTTLSAALATVAALAGAAVLML
jgi:hypothetical protein